MYKYIYMYRHINAHYTCINIFIYTYTYTYKYTLYMYTYIYTHIYLAKSQRCWNEVTGHDVGTWRTIPNRREMASEFGNSPILFGA